MKLIKFNYAYELDASDKAKLKAYKSVTDNVKYAERFAEKIKFEGEYYMPYSEDLKEYYTEDEISRIEEIEINEPIIEI